MNSTSRERIILFDTTLRDGELTPGITFSVQQKIMLAQLLEQMGVDIIEVSYPGRSAKDVEELSEVAKQIDKAIVCGLASSQESEILSVADCLKFCPRSRIHTYYNTRVNPRYFLQKEAVLQEIEFSVSLARRFCEDVEWSAFDATRSEPQFLFKAIETAIKSGATTINIPDSLGVFDAEQFSQLIAEIFERVSNLDEAVVSVHCHNDRGLAVTNSLVALNCGVRQIECSINGLGARKGNADLIEVVERILAQDRYQVNCNPALMPQASEWVRQVVSA